MPSLSHHTDSCDSRPESAVQRGGDVLIGPPSGHAANDVERLPRRRAAVLAGLRLPHAQLGVLSAFPMDHQNDLAGLIVNVGNDLSYKRAEPIAIGATARSISAATFASMCLPPILKQRLRPSCRFGLSQP